MGIPSVLAVLGLTPLLDIAYSQGSLIGSKKGLASLAEHMSRIGGWRLFGEMIPILLAIMLTFIILSGSHARNRTRLAIAGACILTCVGSLAVPARCASA